MKIFGLIIALTAFLVLNENSSFAQGTTVWHWVPNPQQGQGSAFPYPIGAPVYTWGDFPLSSVPIDMIGNGTVDFEFQAAGTGPVNIQVLPHGTNAVLSIPYTPPDIGQEAVALNRSNKVSSLTPVGSAWLRRIDLAPLPMGSDIIAGISGFYLIGQFIDQRGYVGVEFSAADGIHYGALDVAGSSDANLIGFLYGYGYNPIPGEPFDLSEIPPEPKFGTLSGQLTNNAFELKIPQVGQLSCIVQANTDPSTTNWVSLATNAAAPFIFTDTEFTNYPQRFYRALYLP